jgi:hypothetical protein
METTYKFRGPVRIEVVDVLSFGSSGRTRGLSVGGRLLAPDEAILQAKKYSRSFVSTQVGAVVGALGLEN